MLRQSNQSQTGQPGGGGAPGKSLFRLKFDDRYGQPAKDIEFEASNPYEALLIAEEQARSGSAELWMNGERLCAIHLSPNGSWRLEAAD